MRKTLIAISLTAALLGPHTPANAHIPVVLLNSDTTAASGPLLVDGTISFAVRAGFTKAGQKKAFRAGFKADPVEVQLLIMDKRPENRLKNSQIPSLTITSPSGKSTTLKITERTKFLETFTSTNYFYLARYSAPAEEGIYNFTVTSRTKAAVTIGVGYQEIPGEVIRGAAPTPTVAPTPSASATPAGYTMEQVKANNTATKCWSAIDGKVYDLTNWISSHPGGAGAITSLCGTDGTASFKGQHGGSGQPQSRLSGYLLGPLNK
jgi:ribosomal protein L23